MRQACASLLLTIAACGYCHSDYGSNTAYCGVSTPTGRPTMHVGEQLTLQIWTYCASGDQADACISNPEVLCKAQPPNVLPCHTVSASCSDGSMIFHIQADAPGTLQSFIITVASFGGECTSTPNLEITP